MQPPRDEMTRALGERLRNWRLRAGLSQGDLDAASGGRIPKARQSRYENGHVLPHLTTLRVYGDVFNCSMSELLQNIENL